MSKSLSVSNSNSNSNEHNRFKKRRFNFNKRLPLSRQDVHEFITTWLEQTSDENKLMKYKINDEIWNITHSFTREFYFHCVLQNEKTNEYVFHVWNKDYAKITWNDNHNLFEFNSLFSSCFPNFGRYESYSEMIEGVVDKYVKLWKLE